MIAIYARQSVERENSVSIETQIDYCKAVLKPDEKLKDIKIYKDQGASGSNTERAGFKEMIKDIKNGSVEKVITYKLDRISRSLNDFVGILQVFKENGVEFVSSQEAFDTSSVYGDLILKMLIVFAEFERTSIINRVKDAYSKRSEIGLYMGGKRQYGFSLKDDFINGIQTKTLVPNEKELKQIIYIFNYYSDSNTSLRSLLHSLEINNIKPLNGSLWTASKLSAIIKNPVYVKADFNVYSYYQNKGVKIVNDIKTFNGTYGARLYGRTTHNRALNDWSDMKLVLCRHKGIISSDTWLKCQLKLDKNRKLGRSVSNKSSFVSGKIICEQCGSLMTTVKSKKSDNSFRRYFICPQKSHKKICSGCDLTIYADDLENFIDKCIYEKLYQFKTEYKENSYLTKSNLENIKSYLKHIEEQQNKLSDIILMSHVNKELLSALNQKALSLSLEKNKILNTLNQLRTKKQPVLNFTQLCQKWLEADFNQKKAVCQILIYRIIIFKDGTCEIIWNI